MDIGTWIFDFGLWKSGFEFRVLDFGFRSLGVVHSASHGRSAATRVPVTTCGPSQVKHQYFGSFPCDFSRFLEG